MLEAPVQARAEAGLTQAELASRLGTTQSRHRALGERRNVAVSGDTEEICGGDGKVVGGEVGGMSSATIFLERA